MVELPWPDAHRPSPPPSFCRRPHQHAPLRLSQRVRPPVLQRCNQTPSHLLSPLINHPRPCRLLCLLRLLPLPGAQPGSGMSLT
ncbi:hypothetical protein PCASD_25556, partial [Puccinia coronata f. sp. avenae]